MKTQQALFAAGCFWGVQYYFDQVPGVAKTTVGYTGGHTEHPTYDAVCSHATGHAEAVLLAFDPEKVSYRTLLLHFFRMHDPTQLDKQGPDVGDQYRSAIFYFDQEQHKQAVQVRNRRQEQLDTPIVTQILPAVPFYEAEPYHQKFTERTGIGMCHIPYAPVGDVPLR
jgi:methionine-S-sulfoxide reductase